MTSAFLRKMRKMPADHSAEMMMKDTLPADRFKIA